MSAIQGTHQGKLDDEARARRRDKNARNRSRKHPVGSQHGLDMPVAGSNKRIDTRLFTKGNRRARGLST